MPSISQVGHDSVYDPMTDLSFSSAFLPALNFPDKPVTQPQHRTGIDEPPLQQLLDDLSQQFSADGQTGVVQQQETIFHEGIVRAPPIQFQYQLPPVFSQDGTQSADAFLGADNNVYYVKIPKTSIWADNSHQDVSKQHSQSEKRPLMPHLMQQQSHTRQTSTRKSNWDRNTDAYLLQIINETGARNWHNIADQLFLRANKRFKPDAICQHYHRVLNTNISHKKWTEEEDERLIAAVMKSSQGHWREVASKLGNRTDVQVRARLERIRERVVASGKLTREWLP